MPLKSDSGESDQQNYTLSKSQMETLQEQTEEYQSEICQLKHKIAILEKFEESKKSSSENVVS